MDKEKPEEKHLNPLQTIKKYCKIQCCCVGEGNDGATELWKNCEVTECLLWPFRMGTNPFRKKRVLTEEQRKATADRLKDARNKK